MNTEKNIEKNIEYIGYGALSNILLKIFKVISRFASKFAKQADKLRFEQYKMIFGERDDDIYIASYPKSGTTLMQMILYQLTTDGKMNFKHIYEVSPWIRNASFRKQKPIELPSPRLIKTHDYYKDFSKNTKGRIIYVYRNGMDVLTSLYHQQKNYNHSDLKFDSFIKKSLKTKFWFKHTQGWFRNKKKLPVLYICYEDLLKNKRREIDKIIEFCQLTPSEEAIDRAIKYSSFDYMKRNEQMFGDQPPEDKKIFDQFIRKGKAGEGEKLFNNKQKEEFTKHYNKMIEPLLKKVNK
ncbi:MAG: sulfotransferase domain-containing protein [Bacteroidetes bacterium]|nr:sulfotransferase domain-containing protein [Bacteroidota bacterium]